MTEETQRTLLAGVAHEYSVPDPAMVSKLPKRTRTTDGGWGPTVYLDYVGHAEITAILCEIDALWTWEPVEWVEGSPAIQIHNVAGKDGQIVDRVAVMWGRLTLLGHSRIGVGTCSANKADMAKELVGDFLRNAAMRFGIGVSLWAKSDWAERTGISVTEGQNITADAPEWRPKPRTHGEAARTPREATEKQLDTLRRMADERGVEVALDGLTAEAASALMDELKKTPRKDRP